ncbi:MAG: XdhC family protein [Eubacteriales bacterium]|jgi:xanthine dehydrogenase accessory factor
MNWYAELADWCGSEGVQSYTVLEGPHAGWKAAIGTGELRCVPDQKSWWQQRLADFAHPLPGVYRWGEDEVFGERLYRAPQVVILGGGHISKALCTLLDLLRWPVTVVEDRAEFARQERFPQARVQQMEFSEYFAQPQQPGNWYYVIATRGHAHDALCLEAILRRPFGYVGMLGSRKKIARTRALMEEKGIATEVFDRVHTPIGLDIGGQTPEEIAVSIAAEMIQEKNRVGLECYLDEQVAEALHQSGPAVLVRIVAKEGSAPRGVGARMLIRPHDTVGTIGGGKVEFTVVEEARRLLEQKGGCVCRSYALNNEEAGALGMWCGGRLRVALEPMEE